MSTETIPQASVIATNIGGNQRDYSGIALTIVTFVGALFWVFPMYWAVVTSFKPEIDVVAEGIQLWPRRFTVEAYEHVWNNTNITLWYLNSFVTSAFITIGVIVSSAGCAYALSQLRFPGRRLLYWMILGSFMVPIQGLIINHFVLMAQFKLLNSWTGIILPQLIVPVVVIVYKQFFDTVPKEFREAALMDNAGHLKILFRIYLPMNWGVTSALAIVTFIGAWNAFLWPFLAATGEAKMTVPVGITQVNDAFGIAYARTMASAVMAALPVVLVYMVFQRRVTQAIMLSSGIKG